MRLNFTFATILTFIFLRGLLKSFAECSGANNQCEETTDDIYETFQFFLWNNEFICINGKALFYKTLAEKGISVNIWRPYFGKKNELPVITKSNLRQLDFTPLDQFRLISLLNAVPNQWRYLLNRPLHPVEKAFNLQDQIVLHLNGQNTLINKAVSKTIYKELRNRVTNIPSAQKNYRSCFIDDTLDWPEIYSLPHRVTSDTPQTQRCVNFSSNYQTNI